MISRMSLFSHLFEDQNQVHVRVKILLKGILMKASSDPKHDAHFKEIVDSIIATVPTDDTNNVTAATIVDFWDVDDRFETELKLIHSTVQLKPTHELILKSDGSGFLPILMWQINRQQKTEEETLKAIFETHFATQDEFNARLELSRGSVNNNFVESI